MAEICIKCACPMKWEREEEAWMCERCGYFGRKTVSSKIELTQKEGDDILPVDKTSAEV